MLVALGHFLTKIVWKREAVLFPVPKWQKIDDAEGSASNRVVLWVEEREPYEGKLSAEGWNGFDLNCCKQAVYVQDGMPLFSLQYTVDGSEVKVIVPEGETTHAKLGIMYGMLLALHKCCIGLHGVTLLCGDEIVILSAPSGTGKTTLANLLEKYCGAIVINGDFALLSISDDGVVFEPTPFCGSSGRCLNHRVKVNRVVFLEQSKSNEWRNLNSREAIMRFMSNVFIPTWDKDMQQVVQENVVRCASMLNLNAFAFAPTQEAAEMFSNQL